MTLHESLTLAAEDRRVNSDNFSTKVIFTTYRLNRWFAARRSTARSPFRLAWRVLMEPTHRLHLIMTMLAGCEVPYSTKIGRRLRVVHGWHGIFLSVWATVGDDVVLLQHVTVGSNNHTSGKPGAPTLGNRVFVGAGAKIIGPVTVADDARVGANAIVVTDVPAFATAISPKAVIREPKPDARVINTAMPTAP